MCIPAVQMASKSALRLSAVQTASNGASGYQNGIEGHASCPDGINKGALRLSCQNCIEGCMSVARMVSKRALQLHAVQMASKGALGCRNGIERCAPDFCSPDGVEGCTPPGCCSDVIEGCLRLSKWHRKTLQMSAAQMASKGALRPCKFNRMVHSCCLLSRWHRRVPPEVEVALKGQLHRRVH